MNEEETNANMTDDLDAEMNEDEGIEVIFLSFRCHQHVDLRQLVVILLIL